jgi:GntR family transcriptional regulator
MIPIYEQIMESIRKQITEGQIQNNDALPSVRALAKELKISALTVKKAYDQLEAEGWISTVHGKGSYVSTDNAELFVQQQQKELEKQMELLISKARLAGLSAEQIREMLEIYLED